MFTMDPLGMTIAGITLVGGLIVVLKFVSERPKRDEIQQMINLNIQPIMQELKYIRERIDKMPVRKTK